MYLVGIAARIGDTNTSPYSQSHSQISILLFDWAIVGMVGGWQILACIVILIWALPSQHVT